jgi:hypothetical protein
MQAEEEKEARKQYIEDRLQEAEDQNKELEERISELKSILSHTLKINDSIPFHSLLISGEYEAFSLPERRPCWPQESETASTSSLLAFRKLNQNKSCFRNYHCLIRTTTRIQCLGIFLLQRTSHYERF